MLLASTICLCSDLIKIQFFITTFLLCLQNSRFLLAKIVPNKSLQGAFKMILFLCPTQVSVMMETPTW